MTTKQLQALISAGVFSAALLSGAAYADDTKMEMKSKTIKAEKKAVKHKKHAEKAVAAHDCAGKNSCKGQGGCKTASNECAGKNDCAGKGGCSTAMATEMKADDKTKSASCAGHAGCAPSDKKTN